MGVDRPIPRGLAGVALAALVVLATAPYLEAIHAPLLYDDRTLLDNRWLQTEAGPVNVFQHHFWYGTRHETSDLYRPLTILSLAANMRLAPSREGIRGVNLALHALAVLAFAGVLRTLLAERDAGRGGFASWWLPAALFAVHPLGSEAVLWAVGRAEILAALFGLLAFAAFVRHARAAGGRGRLHLASVAAFFAALLFKESAASWLVIGAAWVAIDPTAPRGAAARARLAGGYVAAFAAFLVLRGGAVGWGRVTPPFVDNPLVTEPIATRAVNAVLLFGRYLLKMLWPGTLSIEYGFDQIPVVRPFPVGAAAALALGGAWVALILVVRRRGRPDAAFLAALVPGAFAVTGNLLAPIGTIFAERLAYLPLAGFCGLLGLALSEIRPRAVLAIVAALALAAGSWRIAVRAADYRDLATLTEATLRASPRSVKTLANAGRTRMRQGNAAAAIPLFEQAIAIWPEYTRARELLEQARRTGIIDPSRQPSDEIP